MLAALLGTGDAGGFGSLISNAVNVYVLAQNPSVHRDFRLFERQPLSQCSYSPLSTFFDDFSADSPCPLYENLQIAPNYDRSPWALDTAAMNFTVKVTSNPDRVVFSGPDQAVVEYFGNGFEDFRNAILELQQQYGVKKVSVKYYSIPDRRCKLSAPGSCNLPTR